MYSWFYRMQGNCNTHLGGYSERLVRRGRLVFEVITDLQEKVGGGRVGSGGPERQTVVLTTGTRVRKLFRTTGVTDKTFEREKQINIVMVSLGRHEHELTTHE